MQEVNTTLTNDEYSILNVHSGTVNLNSNTWGGKPSELQNSDENAVICKNTSRWL